MKKIHLLQWCCTISRQGSYKLIIGRDLLHIGRYVHQCHTTPSELSPALLRAMIPPDWLSLPHSAPSVYSICCPYADFSVLTLNRALCWDRPSRRTCRHARVAMAFSMRRFTEGREGGHVMPWMCDTVLCVQHSSGRAMACAMCATCHNVPDVSHVPKGRDSPVGAMDRLWAWCRCMACGGDGGDAWPVVGMVGMHGLSR